MAKKKSKKKLIDLGESCPLEYDGLKPGDEIIYTRLSDNQTSIGTIRYFHLGDTIYATVIDLLLGNFQTTKVDDIIRNPTEVQLRPFWSKIETRRRRRSSSRGKTKKI